MSLLQRDALMTVAELFTFTDPRPDGDRWEPIDGEPVMNRSPIFDHG